VIFCHLVEEEKQYRIFWKDIESRLLLFSFLFWKCEYHPASKISILDIEELLSDLCDDIKVSSASRIEDCDLYSLAVPT